MIFKCLTDSFLKEFTTKVVSCEPGTFAVGGKELKGFNVILEDTILFPEGGGQPCDHGTINGKQVHNVIKKGLDAVHFVESEQEFTPGEDAHQVLDWDRRLDHTQQHTGEHLITALLGQTYNIETPTWWLGAETSFVELSSKEFTAEQQDYVEKRANELILEGRVVTVTDTSVEEGMKFPNLRISKGLPPDLVGPVRVIDIEGVESNMCCGTHVRNLGQLQAIKLLHVEKTKGKLLLHFIIGNRILKRITESYKRELEMNLLLQGGPASHIDLIKKLQTNLKTALKSFKGILKETAIVEAEKVKADDRPYFTLHRKDGIEQEFIQVFLKHAPANRLYFLTVGDGTGKGLMVLRGDPDVVAKIGPAFMELLDGKGNGKGNNFQGKVNNLNKIAECEAKLKEMFAHEE